LGDEEREESRRRNSNFGDRRLRALCVGCRRH
jgi:hypothetical protein